MGHKKKYESETKNQSVASSLLYYPERCFVLDVAFDAVSGCVQTIQDWVKLDARETGQLGTCGEDQGGVLVHTYTTTRTYPHERREKKEGMNEG